MKPLAGVPWRPLVGLTLAVLALHWLALQSAAPTLGSTRASAGPALAVRAIVAPMPAQDEPDAPSARIPEQAPASQRALARPAAPPSLPTVASAPVSAAPPAALPPALPTTALPWVTVPGTARWRYQALAQWRGLQVPGQAELAWRHDGQQYEAALQVTVPGLPTRRQHSTGRVGPEGLAPLRFSDRTRSEEATHFDREQGRIVFSSNRPPVPLQAGAQDRLSVLLQLAALVASDPARLVPGSRVVLQTASTREAPDWEFHVEGTEELALPGGTVQAVKLVRSPQREYDLRLELWLVPGPDYGPVRLRLTPPNGDSLDLQWSGTDRS